VNVAKFGSKAGTWYPNQSRELLAWEEREGERDGEREIYRLG
jgi:hypothetical protein